MVNRRVPVIHTDKDTFLHRRDPRVKLVALVILFAVIYMAPSWQWMAALSVVGLGLALVARVPKKWLAILLLIQVPNATTYFLFPIAMRMLSGQPALQGSFDFALKIVLSWQVALFFSISIFTSMSLTELTDGLRGLHVPELAVFTFQYVLLLFYVTISDLFRIMDAMKLKGVHIETKNPLRLAANIPKLVIPMIITVLRRAETMMAVLKMRGYSFTERPELATDLKFDAGDLALIVFAFAVTGTSAAVNYGVVDQSLFPAVLF